jgi:hypothetical protein
LKTLRCITDDVPRDRICNEDIRDICEIQDEPESRDEHEEIIQMGWMMISLQKSQRMENQTFSDYLDGLPNVGAKVGHERYGRTGIKYIS